MRGIKIDFEFVLGVCFFGSPILAIAVLCLWRPTSLTHPQDAAILKWFVAWIWTSASLATTTLIAISVYDAWFKGVPARNELTTLLLGEVAILAVAVGLSAVAWLVWSVTIEMEGTGTAFQTLAFTTIGFIPRMVRRKAERQTKSLGICLRS